MEKSQKKFHWSTFLYGFLALVLTVVSLSLLVVYFFPNATPSLQSLVRRLPYPAVVVGYGNVISFRELSENMESIKHFYENQDFSQLGFRIDFSTEEGKKRLKVREKEVLNKMIEDEAIIRLANERGVFVSQEMARQGVARKLEEYGNADQVKQNLERLYGWSLTDFEEKVVVPSLYEEKLNELFQKETNPSAVAKEKIEKATEALRKGADFAQVVKQYSDGQTADAGGDLGWFALEDLAPELRTPVTLQKVGVPSNVIESSLGFHIILVEEVKKEKDKQLYRIRQIFARKETFADWLSEQMRAMPMWVLDPDYRFDDTNARVEFRSSEWQKFEEDLYKKASGDPSFLL
jgi:parvulin-like peptidyl-prolyl isomerase